MKWALIDDKGIVQNIIVIDERNPIKPPAGMTLEQINDWIDINDDKNKAAPVDLPPDPVQEKLHRNKAGILNLALIGSFVLYKQNNPTAKFSDFMDVLESTQQAMLNALNG